MGQRHQLGGFGHVLFDGVVAAVEHDAGEAGLETGLGALVAAVIQVEGHRHRDAQAAHHGAHHGGHGLIAGHILARALGHAQDHRAVQLLRGQQHGFGPFQVVDVELAHGIVAVAGLLKHFGCAY